MSNPLVSIIIPCYKQIHYLPKAVESCIQQTYENIEVIIVDDGNDIEISKSDFQHDRRVKLVRQPNGGLSSARNLGLKCSKGTLIKFLDSDDWLAQNCIELQVNSIRNVDSTISVIGYYLTRDDGIEKVIPYFDTFLPALLYINVAPIHSYLYPVHLINAISGFDESAIVAKGHEDYDLNLRLACLGARVNLVHEHGAYYYHHSKGMSGNKTHMHISRHLVTKKFLQNYLSGQYKNVSSLTFSVYAHSLVASIKYGFVEDVKEELKNLIDTFSLAHLDLFSRFELENYLAFLGLVYEKLGDLRQSLLPIKLLAELERTKNSKAKFHTDQRFIGVYNEAKYDLLPESSVRKICELLANSKYKLLCWGMGNVFSYWKDWFDLIGYKNLIGTDSSLTQPMSIQGVEFFPYESLDLESIDFILICSKGHYWQLNERVQQLGFADKVLAWKISY